ncbi:MAG: adenylyltransferase/cytidyltransferase family protein [Herpetosiphon sp.]
MSDDTLKALLQERHKWREAQLVCVFTNGVFDLLHYGHLQYLQRARALGDVLVVGLNSDASTRSNKGPLRPLVGELERAALIAALRPVSKTVIFDELTAEALVAALQPDIYVKGGDYEAAAGGMPAAGKPLPEAHIVEQYGGQIQILPYLAGHSSSELIALIRSRYGADNRPAER